ncbi:MAG: hypothetical protein A2X86_12245 [Bdellovibrionales bacterium GWA2_49_15]|nr:MAG: hypothetical protein A2X86_12245 [Bdellovibrionales bacterium GWA2_49_15]
MPLEYFNNVRHDAIALLGDDFHQTCLEVGCGTGNTLGYLKEKKQIGHAVGLEVVDSCRESKHKNIDEFIVANAEDWDFLGRKYNLILLLDVVEHLKWPYEFLQKCCLHVEENGHIIVSLPNINNLRILKNLICLDRFEYATSGLLDVTHLRFFTKTTFLEQMSKQVPKLQLQKISYNFEDLPAVGLFKWIPFINKFFICQYVFKFKILK